MKAPLVPSEDRGRHAPHGYFSESASPPAYPRSWYAGLLQSPTRLFKVLFLLSVSSSAPPSFVFLCRLLCSPFLVVFLSSHGVRESLRVPKITPGPHPVVLTRRHGGYDRLVFCVDRVFCVEFAWHSRDGLLGEHIEAALGSHDVELVSIAATSVVSHNGCHSTALPGRNCMSCWRWLTWKGTETTGVAKRGCHEHGLAVVTRFGVASPLLFVLFVVLLENSASGHSGPGRNPSVEQQSGLPRVSRRQMAFLLRVSPVTRVTAVVSTSRTFSSQLICATSPSTRDVCQSREAMGNHAQSLSRCRSFSLPCPGYDLYSRGGIFNVRVPAHTRARSMSLGLSHLNRACWLGVWPPLQISSH